MEVSPILLNIDVPSIEVSQRRGSTMPCNVSIPYITYILPLAIYKLWQTAELVLPVRYTSFLDRPLQMAKSDYYKFYQKCTCTEYSSVLSEAKSSKFFVVLNSQIVQRIRGQSIQARGSFQNGALQKFQALQLTQEDHFWTCKSSGFFQFSKRSYLTLLCY